MKLNRKTDGYNRLLSRVTLKNFLFDSEKWINKRFFLLKLKSQLRNNPNIHWSLNSKLKNKIIISSGY
ncbi:hypothetical protein FM106_03575 [Brachybacterium faecium]|nr:hypothetical protein FM106_03575 [Brachybacterium faecium]